MKPSTDCRKTSRRSHLGEEEEPDDCTARVSSSKYPSVVASDNRHQEIRIAASNHQEQFRPHWNNKVQFDETFV
ncbi:putative Popeye domain containing protein [Daphnia magna]|uniref:Putative Popeye domain containing protein n=1 Tax=Daphnia magna TaxID=35525 RepID=A0A164FRP2_9CRUS|nr:putative Popeye domain containing protein [Daphnia magna]